MTSLILLCIGSLVCLLWLLRKDRISLGLPVAYLFSLLLIHVPGAFAHVVGGDILPNSDLVEVSMRFTAVGSICFVFGVWSARYFSSRIMIRPAVAHHRFWWFCLFGGWFVVYGLSSLNRIPSLGAAVNQGGAIWMLGVLMGLRFALQHRNVEGIIIWLGALMVYPILMLLLGGFLSYGAAAIIIVLSALTISAKNRWRLAAAIVVAAFVSLSIFVNYYQHRKDIREQVWGGAPLEERTKSVGEMVKDFEWLNTSNPMHLQALDLRLNQNYFVGLAARRIERGEVQYLRGSSIWEGLLSLVPRAVWPEKPVFAGSPELVSRMTGLRLSPTTSFGVGNVMEFQINFGWTGIIVGFLVLGWLIGILDLKAALAEGRGDLGRVIVFFLPCVALIQPNGSLVELFSSAAAALVAAFLWEFVWKWFSQERARKARRAARMRATLRAHPTDCNEPVT